MKSICINYMTRLEGTDENMHLIKAVFQELHEKKLEGVQYAVFKMAENVFVHLAQFENQAANEAFRMLPAFQAFQKDIDARLANKPIITSMKQIGSFSTLRYTI